MHAAGNTPTRIINPPSGKCLTMVRVSGSAVGLDAGTTVRAAQLSLVTCNV